MKVGIRIFKRKISTHQLLIDKGEQFWYLHMFEIVLSDLKILFIMTRPLEQSIDTRSKGPIRLKIYTPTTRWRYFRWSKIVFSYLKMLNLLHHMIILFLKFQMSISSRISRLIRKTLINENSATKWLHEKYF